MNKYLHGHQLIIIFFGFILVSQFLYSFPTKLVYAQEECMVGEDGPICFGDEIVVTPDPEIYPPGVTPNSPGDISNDKTRNPGELDHKPVPLEKVKGCKSGEKYDLNLGCYPDICGENEIYIEDNEPPCTLVYESSKCPEGMIKVTGGCAQLTDFSICDENVNNGAVIDSSLNELPMDRKMHTFQIVYHPNLLTDVQYPDPYIGNILEVSNHQIEGNIFDSTTLLEEESLPTDNETFDSTTLLEEESLPTDNETFDSTTLLEEESLPTDNETFDSTTLLEEESLPTDNETFDSTTLLEEESLPTDNETFDSTTLLEEESLPTDNETLATPGELSNSLASSDEQPLSSQQLQVIERLNKLSEAARNEGNPTFALAISDFTNNLQNGLRYNSHLPQIQIVLGALDEWKNDPGDKWGIGLLDGDTIHSRNPNYASAYPNAAKCNIFVAEVIYLTTGKEFNIYSPNSKDILNIGKHKPYVAADWGNPKKPIEGFQITNNPIMGDIWSNGVHMGIYLGYYNGIGLYISARDVPIAPGITSGVQQEYGIHIKELPPNVGVYRTYAPQ
ncbi:hypothetical protein [Candidatus Nitrosocosmicus sp. T]